jgi:hypothetical protein
VQQFIDANHSPAEVVIIHGVSPHVAPVASSGGTEDVSAVLTKPPERV